MSESNPASFDFDRWLKQKPNEPNIEYYQRLTRRTHKYQDCEAALQAEVLNRVKQLPEPKNPNVAYCKIFQEMENQIAQALHDLPEANEVYTPR